MRISDWSSDVCSSDLHDVSIEIGPLRAMGRQSLIINDESSQDPDNTRSLVSLSGDVLIQGGDAVISSNWVLVDPEELKLEALAVTMQLGGIEHNFHCSGGELFDGTESLGYKTEEDQYSEGRWTVWCAGDRLKLKGRTRGGSEEERR